MKIPQGFAKHGETKVCRLSKSLCGIHQASRDWYKKFTIALLTIRFRKPPADSFFIFKQKETNVATLIYADCVVIVGHNATKCGTLKNI